VVFVISGMENAISGVENTISGVENIISGMENTISTVGLQIPPKTHKIHRLRRGVQKNAHKVSVPFNNIILNNYFLVQLCALVS